MGLFELQMGFPVQHGSAHDEFHMRCWPLALLRFTPNPRILVAEAGSLWVARYYCEFNFPCLLNVRALQTSTHVQQ